MLMSWPWHSSTRQRWFHWFKTNLAIALVDFNEAFADNTVRQMRIRTVETKIRRGWCHPRDIANFQRLVPWKRRQVEQDLCEAPQLMPMSGLGH